MSTSSSTSPEDNRPLKWTHQRSRITANTVSVHVRPQPTLLLSSSIPLRANSSASKLVDKSMSDAPGIQSIIRDATSVVDLTAFSSASKDLPPEVPISVKSQAPLPLNLLLYLARI